MKFEDAFWIGTAFQIGPKEILTCSHNFFHRGEEEEPIAVSYFPAAKGALDYGNMGGIRVKTYFFPL